MSQSPRINDHELAYRIRLVRDPTGQRRHRWTIIDNEHDVPVETSQVSFGSMASAYDSAEIALERWLERSAPNAAW